MKKRGKILIDIMMTGILLFLMAYMLTGQQMHEWLGAAMFVLFLLHNALNYRWYKGLLRGKYNPYRIFHTAVNLLLLLSMSGLMASGIIMSQFVFGFLPIQGGMAFARTTHLLCSYWAFLLMSLHLGLHWGAVTGKMGKAVAGTGKAALWNGILRVAAAAAAGYGLYAFIKNNLLSYMLLQNMFVFFDPEQPLPAFLLEYAAMMEWWSALAYYTAKALKKAGTGKAGTGKAETGKAETGKTGGRKNTKYAGGSGNA